MHATATARSGRRGRSRAAVAELRLSAPVVVVVGRRSGAAGIATTPAASWEGATTLFIGGGRRWSDGRRRGECDAYCSRRGGASSNNLLVGTLKTRGLSLSVKEGPGGDRRVSPPYTSFGPPLRRLCLSPFGGVQSSRASRATRTLLSDIPGSVENPENRIDHPIFLRGDKSVIIDDGVASLVCRRHRRRLRRRRRRHRRRQRRGSGVVVETRAPRANLREPEEDAKRTALLGRGVRKTTPTSSPLSIGRGRASAHLPLYRGCLDSLGNRRHTGTSSSTGGEPTRLGPRSHPSVCHYRNCRPHVLLTQNKERFFLPPRRDELAAPVCGESLDSKLGIVRHET